MRTWVVLVGLTLGLSGCIGGHVTTVTPRGNATMEGADAAHGDASDDVPPWSTEEGGEGDGTTETPDGKGAKDAGDGPADDVPPPDEGAPPPDAEDPDPVQGILDDAPGSGGNDVGGDLEEAVDDTLNDLSDPSSTPKEPL